MPRMQWPRLTKNTLVQAGCCGRYPGYNWQTDYINSFWKENLKAMPFTGVRDAGKKKKNHVYYNTLIDVTDEFPSDFAIHRMELLHKVVRQSRLLLSHRKTALLPDSNTEPNSESTYDVEIANEFPLPMTRSKSVDLTAMTLQLPEMQRTKSAEICSFSSHKQVSFDPNHLSDRMEIFPFKRSDSSIASMDSFSSGDTIGSHASGHYNDAFLVTLFNRFGTRPGKQVALVDAKSVSHVYKGCVLVTDMVDSKVVLFERSGKPQRTFLTKECTEPWGAVMTPAGQLAVTLQRQHCVTLWSKDGRSMAEMGHDVLKRPAGIAVDKTGRIVIADEKANEVFVFDHAGVFLFRLSDCEKVTFKQPRYVCCSNSGRIIVSDSGNHCIKVFGQNGEFLFQFGSYGRASGEFKFPYGVCVDQHGNIIVADHYNDRVVMFNANGDYLQDLVTSSSGIKGPCGVSVRCAHNRKLYITHGGLRASEVVVYKLTPLDGEITISVKQFV